jgi:ParB/RepB/Spo0J family partition protein
MGLRHAQLPLGSLVPTPGNRDIGDVADLVASIRSHGLLQPVVVRATDTIEVATGLPLYDVVAGNRRLLALQAIHGIKTRKQRATLVDCLVLDGDGHELDRERTIAENVIRKPMTPLEECDAFLRAGGHPAEVAARFGCSERLVRQRLQLARLSSDLRRLLMDGKLPLAVAQSASAHGLQLQQELAQQIRGNPYAEPQRLLLHLTQKQEIPVERAIFDVEASGLAIDRDLFGEAAWFADREAFFEAQRTAVLKRLEEDEKAGRTAWFVDRSAGDERAPVTFGEPIWSRDLPGWGGPKQAVHVLHETGHLDTTWVAPHQPEETIEVVDTETGEVVEMVPAPVQPKAPAEPEISHAFGQFIRGTRLASAAWRINADPRLGLAALLGHLASQMRGKGSAPAAALMLNQLDNDGAGAEVLRHQFGRIAPMLGKKTDPRQWYDVAPGSWAAVATAFYEADTTNEEMMGWLAAMLPFHLGTDSPWIAWINQAPGATGHLYLPTAADLQRLKTPVLEKQLRAVGYPGRTDLKKAELCERAAKWLRERDAKGCPVTLPCWREPWEGEHPLSRDETPQEEGGGGLTPAEAAERLRLVAGEAGADPGTAEAVAAAVAAE